MKQLALRLLMCTTVSALVMAACAAPSATSWPATPTVDAAPVDSAPAIVPNGPVDVGGRRLMFHCAGQGSPTVILEAGSGSTSESWAKVQFGGDRSYRVCSYDRANLGDSDEAPKPRTYLDMANDLHALLVNAQIGGPYILVGHSGGGSLVRVFRDQYPEQVVGLVLVDSAHPDMGSRLLAGLPPRSLFESKALRFWRIWLSYMSDSQGSRYPDQEGLDTKAGNAQVKAARPLGSLPFVVISRSPDNPTFENTLPLPAGTNAKLRQIWQGLQSELAELSTNSAQIIATHAGHDIPAEEPELILEAIRKLVSEARSQGEVANPAALPADPAVAAHAPKILRVVERQGAPNGYLVICKDIYYSDGAGDAVFVTTSLISANPPRDWLWRGGFLTASANDQKQEGLDTITWGCDRQESLVIEARIVDQALNWSEPVNLTITCPAPQRKISLVLIAGLATGLGLLAGAAWLLLRHRRAKQVHGSLAGRGHGTKEDSEIAYQESRR